LRHPEWRVFNLLVQLHKCLRYLDEVAHAGISRGASVNSFEMLAPRRKAQDNYLRKNKFGFDDLG
jgi:hypothetical protein